MNALERSMNALKIRFCNNSRTFDTLTVVIVYALCYHLLGKDID